MFWTLKEVLGVIIRPIPDYGGGNASYITMFLIGSSSAGLVRPFVGARLDGFIGSHET
jgi:hypothetical protein